MSTEEHLQTIEKSLATLGDGKLDKSDLRAVLSLVGAVVAIGHALISALVAAGVW
jgi:hypothetical protein